MSTIAKRVRPPCKHPDILCPAGFGLQDYVSGGLECYECGEMVINDVAPCREMCGCMYSDSES